MQKHFNEGNIILTLGILAFCYFSYQGLTRDFIESEKDLSKIEGKYSHHTFLDNTGFKNMGREYYIWIEGYSNRFQVPANYLGVFQKALFEQKVNKGDKISISYSKFQSDKINSTEDVFLTSVRVNGFTYLNKNAVLKIEDELSNSNSDFYIGLMYLAAGLFVFIRHRLKRKKLMPT
tara:strand:+ start:610 stop:1140 length:531 start_codon:yes stop_codon:yes gene_type:complete